MRLSPTTTTTTDASIFSGSLSLSVQFVFPFLLLARCFLFVFSKTKTHSSISSACGLYVVLFVSLILFLTINMEYIGTCSSLSTLRDLSKITFQNTEKTFWRMCYWHVTRVLWTRDFILIFFFGFDKNTLTEKPISLDSLKSAAEGYMCREDRAHFKMCQLNYFLRVVFSLQRLNENKNRRKIVCERNG